ncbi:MAG: histidine phosphotransferase family protein [Alphaproteobacteria bacterium]|jgi:histidine phosphotransferase ChpT|nr:hypothetical protein [Candidatus Jidaibacter sp.]
MESELIIAELLATKICHDFSGGIGAIHNGIEFIEEEGSISTSDALFNIISSNTINLISKIKLYRFMFGLSSADGVVNLENVKAFLSAAMAGSKTTLVWDLEYISINNRQAKFLALLAYIAHENLIYGGTLNINIQTGEQNAIICNIICSSTKTHLKECLKDLFILKQEIMPSLDNLFPVIASTSAREINADVSLSVSDMQFTFYITFN